MIDPLSLANVNADNMAKAGYQCVDILQDYAPHEQVAAISMLLLILCEHHNANPQQVFTVTKNIINDEREKTNPRIRAFRLYTKTELDKIK